MSKFSPLHHLPRRTTFLLQIYSSQCLFYQISLLKSTVSSKIALSHRASPKGGFTFFIAYDFLKEKANEPGPCSPIPDRGSVFLVTPSIFSSPRFHHGVKHWSSECEYHSFSTSESPFTSLNFHSALLPPPTTATFGSRFLLLTFYLL